MRPPGSKVLVVEDQRLVAADLEDTLQRLGYVVVGSVASGEEAIPRAVELRPDLVLMDIRLRGELDGIQTATAIRERLDVPIIYLTAYADEETVQRAMVTGPYGYLLKPFNERELHAAIDVAIYKHRTDRLLADERSRRQAAEEFKFLVEGVQDHAIFLLDLSGQVSTWNPGVERIAGYAPEEILGRHFSVFFTPQDIAAGRPEAELRAAVEHGRFEYEAWQVRKDGSRFWAGITISALRDAQGQVRGFAKVTRDLTAQREARLRLEDSVARAQVMAAQALDCIVSMDASGRVTEWNPSAERTFGFSREEAIGQEMAQLIIPERLRGRHRAGLEQYLRTGEGPILGKRLEMPAINKAKEDLAVELTVTMIPVGPAPSFTAFLRDITGRKEAEHEREYQQMAQRVLDQATAALASSLELSVTLEKAARCAVPELADWCLVELVNEAGELRLAAAAHADAQQEALARRLIRELPVSQLNGAQQVFATGKPQLHPRPDEPSSSAAGELPELFGRLAVASAVSAPIFVRGAIEGVLSLLRAGAASAYGPSDLGLTQELARRIGLAVENARLFRDAQDAIRARDEFLQIASHELKTPLTPLQLQLEMMTRAAESTGTQGERLVARLRTATRQTIRLGRLVESLLDVSRITSGRLSLETEPFNLSEMVREVTDRFQAEARRSGSDLTLRAQTEVVGRWDRSRLDQIVSNLLSNALKYGAGKPIDIEVQESDGTVRVVVADHGIGIDKETLPRIFRRFERGVPVRHYGGLGLGLFIAREFAEAHGGTIVVQSEAGVGSTFTLALPRITRDQPAGASPRASRGVGAAPSTDSGQNGQQ